MSRAGSILLRIALVRTVYGALSILWPKAIFGPARMRPGPDTRYFNALFGGRDLTVAATIVALVRAGREREALLVNASCEATDLASLAQEIRARGGVDSTVAGGIGFNVMGWAGCAQVARALRERS
jgi:hypothetical protein